MTIEVDDGSNWAQLASDFMHKFEQAEEEKRKKREIARQSYKERKGRPKKGLQREVLRLKKDAESMGQMKPQYTWFVQERMGSSDAYKWFQ